MAQATVQVGQDADGKSAKGIGDGRAGRELDARVEVDDVPGKRDDDHGGHLLVLCLDGEGGEEDVERHEEEVPVRVQRRLALCFAGGVGVDGPVDGGADGDAVAEEQRVDDCEDEADGAWDDGARLQLEGGAENELGSG